MRLLVLIASLALAMTALAEDKKKPPTLTKQVDKSSPMLMSDSDNSDSTGDDAKSAPTRAQDYNSSRSNTTSRSGVAADRNQGQQGESASNGKRSGGVVHRDVATRNMGAADLDNDGRNDAACRDGVDDDCDGVVDAGNRGTTARDYNSSRSNNINGAVDPDSDGDSLGDDRHVRKKPGKR